MFSYFASIALFFLGVYWCYEVVKRFPDDINEFRQVKEPVRRIVIIFVWALTAIIATILVSLTITA
ncbi:MAG: hypothetical protein ACYS8Y_05660, partial [Planctomycetota bacterium]